MYLMSTGPNSWPAAPVVFQPIAATPDGEHLFFQTFDRLTVDDGDTEADVYEARFPDTSGYPRPKGAAPLRLSLVPAFERCTAPNRLHGPGLVFGSCAPPVRVPGRLTVGTPDANGEAANSVGSVRLVTLPGNPATPQDEADVQIQLQDLDVREAGDLSDYEGELELSLAVRVTDRDALDGPAVPVTQEDAGLSVIVPCAATADVAIGAACEAWHDRGWPSSPAWPRRDGGRSGAHDAVQVYDGRGPAATRRRSPTTSYLRSGGIFVPYGWARGSGLRLEAARGLAARPRTGRPSSRACGRSPRSRGNSESQRQGPSRPSLRGSVEHELSPATGSRGPLAARHR